MPVSYAQTKLFQDIYLKKNVDKIEFGNKLVHINIDKKNGNLLSILSNNNMNYVIAYKEPSTDIEINGRKIFNQPDIVFTGHNVESNANSNSVSLHVRQSTGNGMYQLVTTYIVYPDKALVERAAAMSSKKESHEKFSGFYFTLPFAIGEAKDCVVNVPGPFWPFNFTPAGTPYDSLKNINRSYHNAPDGGFGIFSVTNNILQTTCTAFIKTNGDAGYSTSISGNGKSFSLEQKNNIALYLSAGQTVKSDTQQIVITKNFDEALRHYRSVSSQRMHLQMKTAQWAKEAVILEILPEYFKNGFKGITQKLSFYKDIGFNTIYLMPHWKGGYSPIDLYMINSEYGTHEDLQLLVKTAHGLGMKVLFDMVIHGFNKESRVIAEHPEFFYRDHNDTLMIHPNWGSVMTDFMNPAYRQYMKEYVLHDQQTFGNDGYRVDAAAYKGPNWNKAITYPAYRSGAASPQLMQIMLDALQMKKPETVLLSEIFGPVFYTVSNFVHDNQTEAMSFLIKEIEAGRYYINQYKKHIQHVYSVLPKGAVRVFYSRNHDTSWFYEFFGYTPTFMSLEAIHVLFGVPEVFAGDPNYKFNPDDDYNTFKHYKRLFTAKKSFPEFTAGDIFLNEVKADNPNIFSGIRKNLEHTSLALISASNKEERVNIEIDKKFMTGKKEVVFTDILNGLTGKIKIDTSKNQISCKLNPFQALIIRLK